MVQSPPAALGHRLSVTYQLRKEPATPRSPKSITVHETGATPARFRQWGLHQFTVRGVDKVDTVLRMFALTNNILAGHRLLAAPG